MIHFKKYKTLIKLIAIQLFLAIQLYAQETEYVYSNYTVEDGLPGNECHYILQDKKGFIWIATDVGISRYDGYNFNNYGPAEGLTDPVVFTMMMDENGIIWAGGLSNQLFFYDEDEDRFHAYKYNHLIKQHERNALQIAKNFYKDRDTMIIGLTNSGILKIADDGQYTHQSFCLALHDQIYSTPSFTWIIRFSNVDSLYEINYDLCLVDPFEPCNVQKSWKIDEYDYKEIMSMSAAKIGKQNLVSAGGKLHTLVDTTLTYLFRTDKINHALLTKDKKTILSFDHSGGGKLYHNLEENKFDYLFRNVSLTHSMEDNKGGLWFTSLESGVYYIKPLQVKFIDQIHKGKYFKHITKGPGKSIYSSAFTGEIYKFDIPDRESRFLLDLQQEILCSEYDPFSDNLWFSDAKGVYYLDGGIKKKPNIILNGLPRTYSARSLMFNDQDILIGSFNGFLVLDQQNKKIKDDLFFQFWKNKFGRVFSINKIKENLIFSTENGIIKIEDNKDIELYKQDSLLAFRADKIIVDDSTIILATKGAGVVFWDGKDHSWNIGKKDGLSSDFIENIHLDDDGNIWASSIEGLNKIVFENEPYLFKIKIFNNNHGLPSKDIYQIVIIDDNIYASTRKGLVEFKDSPINYSSPKPVLQKIKVNNTELSKEGILNLKYFENNISIDFYTLNYQMEGEIQYRYRINEGDWFYTMTPNLTLLDMESNDYKLFIQSQNEDLIWSPSLTIPFSITLPWWRTFWFILLVILAAMVATYLIMKRNYSVRKKISDIEAELHTLERSALKAQMNPHFIFNSLNSIQNYIMKHDRSNAMDYLSTFARLIRMNLNALNSDKINIEEEIKMLSYYLELEQMRFENKFNFNINVARDINPLDVALPPMLIQPIVENSIIHGMNNRQSKGKIFISFAREENMLKIVVKDNGHWEEKKSKSSIYKSYGLDITKKRIALQPNLDSKIKNSIDFVREDGWTIVTIHLPCSNTR